MYQIASCSKFITCLIVGKLYELATNATSLASSGWPMFGRNSSMNVIHSLAISLYEVTNQLSN